MPKRFLKPGLTTSENWNACDFETQSFYVRLITLVDDYGRYDGRPQILKAHAFPLSEKLTVSKIEKMCFDLVKNGLATFYKAGNKIVLQLQRWEERIRSDSKYPAFDSKCEQMYADASKCTPPPPSPSPSPSPLSADAGAQAKLVLDVPSPEVNLTEFANEIFGLYPRKDGKADALKAIQSAFGAIAPMELRRRVEEYAKAVSQWPADERQFVPWCQKWMNKRRWLDDPQTWVRKIVSANIRNSGVTNDPIQQGKTIAAALAHAAQKARAAK